MEESFNAVASLPCQRLNDGFHRWILTDDEKEHIGDLLGINGMISALLSTSPSPFCGIAHKPIVSDIAIHGTVMNRKRVVCKTCGKFSGLDDLVHNAKHMNIHGVRFMCDVLKNGPKGVSPLHTIWCSQCGEEHDGVFGWPFPQKQDWSEFLGT